MNKDTALFWFLSVELFSVAIAIFTEKEPSVIVLNIFIAPITLLLYLFYDSIIKQKGEKK